MSPPLLLAAAGIAALSGVAALGTRRPAARLALAALAACVALAAALPAAAALGWIGPDAAYLGLAAAFLAHPLAVVFTFAYLTPEHLRRNAPFLGALLGLGVLLAVEVAPAGGTLETAYATFPVNLFLGLCLAAAVAEPLIAWTRFPAQRLGTYRLLLAAIVLVVSGPVLTFELAALQIDAGYLPGATIAVAIQAWTLHATDALPVRPTSGRPRAGETPHRLPQGRIVIFQEARPRYAREVFGSLVRQGARGLILAADGKAISDHEHLLASAHGVPAGRYAAERLVNTVREFAARARGGVLYLEDLGEVAANLGPRRTAELLHLLEPVLGGGKASAIASGSLLFPEEADLLHVTGFTVLKLPAVGTEAAAILQRAVGGGEYLLRSFCQQRGVRPEDLYPGDLADLTRFLEHWLGDLGVVSTDPVVREGWERQLRAGLRELERFRRTSLETLAEGAWPSRRPASVLPTPASAAPTPPAAVDALPAVERAFVDAFGDAGRFLLARELVVLRGRPGRLQARDVAVLRERARALFPTLLGAVQGEEARAGVEARAAVLESRLRQIAGGSL